MGLEYKSVTVGGVTQVENKGKGHVRAFVSVTGIADNVKDVILPGAYTKTLKQRTPKGAWGHDWKTPTARTEEAVELPPGHHWLPKQLSNGQPWPEEAGALMVDMKFNLDTQRGREAYSDVLFFGPQQEWSIGYQVPEGKAYKKDGKRYIKEVDLYEYSPVLFGAMNHARTANEPKSVQDAQLAFKVLGGADIAEMQDLIIQIKEFRDSIGDLSNEASDGEADVEWDGDEEAAEDDELDDEFEDEDEEKADIVDLLRKNLIQTERLLSALEEKEDTGSNTDEGFSAYIEAKATMYDNVTEAASEAEEDLDEDDVMALQEAAEEFDDAVDGGDTESAEEAGSKLLGVVEELLDNDGDSSLSEKLAVLAQVIVDRRSFMDAEIKRQHGFPLSFKTGAPITGEVGVSSFVGNLEDDALMALGQYASEKDDYVSSCVVREMKARGMSYGAKPKKRTGITPGASYDGNDNEMDSDADEMKPKKRRSGAPMARTGTKEEGAGLSTKKKFSQRTRDNYAASGDAMPDGKYPIKTQKDLDNAVNDYNRTGQPADVKAHILKQAKKYKLSLPSTWQDEKSADYVKLDNTDLVEFKSLLAGLEEVALDYED